MTSLFPAILLALACIITIFYPITQPIHSRITHLIRRRRKQLRAIQAGTASHPTTDEARDVDPLTRRPLPLVDGSLPGVADQQDLWFFDHFSTSELECVLATNDNKQLIGRIWGWVVGTFVFAVGCAITVALLWRIHFVYVLCCVGAATGLT